MRTIETRSCLGGPAAGERGFSLVEALIAAGLLLIITLGVLPLFTSAIRSNETGREYMEVTNIARSRAEELLQAPFNSPNLTVDAGTQKQIQEWFSRKERIWKPGVQADVPAGDLALYYRTSVIRQYNIKDIDTLSPAKAQPAGTAADSIHMKEIEVTAVTGNTSGGPLGPSRRATVRLWKSL